MDWRVLSAQHAAERAVPVLHRQMARGLAGLATVAATAPFLGVFGTVYGIATSFRGFNGDRATGLGVLAGYLSEAIVPTALGLAVAITATVGYRYLTAQLADFDIEMQHAARQLPDYLR